MDDFPEERLRVLILPINRALDEPQVPQSHAALYDVAPLKSAILFLSVYICLLFCLSVCYFMANERAH